MKSLLSSQFIKRSKTVLIGTVIGQAITFLSSLIITNYYAPQDLDVLGILTALISIVAGTLMFRSDVLIIQVRDELAVKTFVHSTVISMGASLILCSLCLVLPWAFAKNISEHFIIFMLWTWGYFIFFNSKQLNFKFHQLTDNNLGTISRSVFLLVFYWISGVLKPIIGLLLGGRVLSDYAGSIFQLRKFKSQLLKSDNFRFSLLNHFKKNKDYFLYMTPHHMLVALSNNVFIFFLENKFSLYEVGLFALAQRLIQAPLEMVGNTMSQVALKRFSEHRSNVTNLKKFLLKVLSFSLAIGIVCGFGIFFTVDLFFSFLKPEWQTASTTVKNLIPYFIAVITVLPLNNYLRIAGRAKLQLGIEIAELLIKLSFLQYFSSSSSNYFILSFGALSLSLVLLKSIISLLIKPSEVFES